MTPLMQPTVTPLPKGLSLKGQTVIVTGATAGLGLETARQLVALQSSHVVLAVRNVEKGETAKAQILADPQVKKQNPGGKVSVMRLDLDDYASVAEFAAQVKAEIPVLDLLVINAGLGFLAKYETSPSGHERTIQINYLSNVLLIVGLLEHLKASSKAIGRPSRIVWVGSRNHYEAPLIKKPIPANEPILTSFDNAKRYDFMKRYHDSKLLCAAFLIDLCERVPTEDVLINMMCPGMIATDMSNNLPFPLRLVASTIKSFRARPIEQGGWMLIHSATVNGPETHGQFLLDKAIAKPMPYLVSSEGEAFRDRLWKETLADISSYIQIPSELAAK